MNGDVLFAAGTLLTWAAWALEVWIFALAMSAFSRPPGAARQGISKRMAIGAATAAVLFVTASPLLSAVKQTGPDPWRLPLIWLIVPFYGWLSVVSAVMLLGSLLRFALAVAATERADRLKVAGIWTGFLLLGAWLFLRDPGNKVKILTGGVPMTPGIAMAILLLVFAAIASMTIAAREAKTRAMANTLAAHLTLATGSIVFGIPFLFLLVTSFKESQDMSSPSGIVWLPHVSQTTPYFDKVDPQYKVSYRGDDVVCHIIGGSGSTVQVEILHPLSLAGIAFDVARNTLIEVPKDAALVTGNWKGTDFSGVVINETATGLKRVRFSAPPSLHNQVQAFPPADLQPVRKVGLNWRNYPDALEYLPAESNHGLMYLKNTLFLVVMGVIGTLLSSSLVAYGFSRVRFPGRDALFAVMLATMMLPSAVTLLPTFIVFQQLHAIDTLYPLWVPAFFGSAFNIFLMRQFFLQIPMELEDAAKIDGCNHLETFWKIMMPQIKPVLTVIAIWGFMGAWNDFMGPLIYLNSPEKMPLSYALQLYQGDHGTVDPGLVMAFATMCMVPVLALFFFTQRYFIEGVTLSGLGGR